MPNPNPAVDPVRALYLLAGAILFLSFGYTEMAGSDMWWHIAAGRELLQTGTLFMVDDWSFSAHGEDWLNHEWLADIFYYAWVSAFGVQALVYWKWLVVVATFLTLQYVLYRQTGSALAAFLCAGGAAAVAAPFIDVRPHLYTLLNFALLLALALERRPATWVLALLFLVWVNLHGGFFFGLMALGILLFPWRELSLDNFRGALLVGLVCLGASAINPSGIGTFLYPLKYAFDDTSPFRGLAEWHSPFKPGGIRSPLFFYFMYLPAVAVLYTLPRVRRAVGVPWEGIALTALTFAMALTSRRFIPIFGMSLAIMVAPLLGGLFQQLRQRWLELALGVAALLFALYRMVPYPLASAPAFHYLTAEFSYPADTVDFMQANGLEGKVYAYYNWGGYLHWRTDGAMKVYIDGRADTIYDADTYNQYVGVLSSRAGWMQAVESTGAQYFLWPHFKGRGVSKLNEMAASGEWLPLYRDSVSWLMVHRSVALPPKLRGQGDSPLRDLADARLAAAKGDLPNAEQMAQQARTQLPWQKDACDLLINIYRKTGRESQAQAVLQDCLSYFPTKMLR